MIGLAATATYLPETWMTAAEIADASAIPEQVILEKFGLRGKHIAGPDDHVSDMSVAAASRLLDEHAIDPAEIDVVLYYGSLWKDYPVWQAATSRTFRSSGSPSRKFRASRNATGVPHETFAYSSA